MKDSYAKSKQEWYPHIQFKNHISCIKREEGYMTLFACLLFLTVAGLLLICLDGSLIYQAEARCSMAQVGLSEHLMANYNIPLANRYHLYFLDPRMEKEALEERADAYYNELFHSSSKESLFFTSLWNLQMEYRKIEPYGTLQEQECLYFITQIKEYMKYDMTKKLVLEALGTAAHETVEQTDEIEETVHMLDEKNTAVQESSPETAENTLTPSEAAAGEQADGSTRKNSPLYRIQSILEYGIMGFVTDESNLSELKISSSVLPFGNQKERGMDISMNILKNLSNIKNLLEEHDLDDLTGNLAEKGMLSLYIPQYFNYYGRQSVIGNTRLLYEVEYILGGQDSDKENLEYVVNRLVIFRFALNSVYAFSDPELRKQAFSLAAMLTGATGTPEFVEAVRCIILGAVSLTESVVDVKTLLEGGTVPLLKTKSDWRTSITGQFEENRITSEEGFAYSEYLLLLLTMQDTQRQCFRMQNLMQINIQQEEPEFQIKKCMAGLKIESGVRLKALFHGSEYLFENKETYQY